ncbi:MAG TPA: hemerythrin domain-containing protein [Thermoanaerobaculia bacterium]|nr:hemerythrin domain-containing protein [Thermoanaerobaculia bacterium]
MNDETRAPLVTLLATEHRRLDDLFGRFLSAATPEAAADTIRAFDVALRRHTALEDEHLFSAPPGGKLAPAEGESGRERLFRELALEHVQLRELSGMMARLLSERVDVEGARSLAGNLARRWDAHTAREESEAAALLQEFVDPAADAAIRKALG